jgi:hypothetical protein
MPIEHPFPETLPEEYPETDSDILKSDSKKLRRLALGAAAIAVYSVGDARRSIKNRRQIEGWWAKAGFDVVNVMGMAFIALANRKLIGEINSELTKRAAASDSPLAPGQSSAAEPTPDLGPIVTDLTQLNPDT